MHIDRRRFLSQGLRVSGAIVLAHDAEGRSAIGSESELKFAALEKRISIGAAVASAQLKGDRDFARLVSDTCSRIVPEWEMKWSTIYRMPGIVDLSGMDYLYEYAKSSGLRLRGHPLLWHSRIPSHIKVGIEEGRARTLMADHFRTVIGRYGNLIDSWDVVNEAIYPEDKHEYGLRESPWFRALGPKYVEEAFILARSMAPNARLVYNDYNIEYDRRKAGYVLALLRRLVKEKAPVDAVGLQSHLWATGKKIDHAGLSDFCKEVRDLGLDILITELDVRERKFDIPFHERDATVAGVVEDYLESIFQYGPPKEFVFWGLSDRYSWLSKPDYNPENPRGYLNRGLPFDDKMKRKDVWAVIYSAIKSIK